MNPGRPSTTRCRTASYRGIFGLKILLKSAPNDTGKRFGGADANPYGQPELVGKSRLPRRGSRIFWILSFATIYQPTTVW